MLYVLVFGDIHHDSVIEYLNFLFLYEYFLQISQSF